MPESKKEAQTVTKMTTKGANSRNADPLPDEHKVMMQNLKAAYDKYDRGQYSQEKFKHALKSVSQFNNPS